MPRISNLNPTEFPSLLHWFAASKDGETHRLSLAQVRGLMQFFAGEIAVDETETVADALNVLRDNKANTADVTAALTDLSNAVDASIAALGGRVEVLETSVGSLLRVSVITTSQTFNYLPETRFVEIEVQGGGGGGGGRSSGGTGDSSGAGAGGAGGGCTALAKELNGVSSATLVVGAGGQGQVYAGGTKGGTSSYTDANTTLTAEGGFPGVASGFNNTLIIAIGSIGGGGSGGRVFPGEVGGNGISFGSNLSPNTGLATALGGKGGDSRHGSGGVGASARAGAQDGAVGENGRGFGGGGGGGVRVNSAPGINGGNGAPGVILIKEYK